MKLTRRTLNEALLRLPHPRMVLSGRINPVVVIPIFEPMAVLLRGEDAPDVANRITELRFSFDMNEMDWVLENVDL